VKVTGVARPGKLNIANFMSRSLPEQNTDQNPFVFIFSFDGFK